MNTIVNRLYELEAATPPRRRPTMRWRMSQDVADACAAEAGWIGTTILTGHTLILGYPVVVDTTLPPDSLLAEQADEAVAVVMVDSLDAAWAEAEAALPKGDAIRVVEWVPKVGHPRAGAWIARAKNGTWSLGRSPAAALRALAAELREVGR